MLFQLPQTAFMADSKPLLISTIRTLSVTYYTGPDLPPPVFWDSPTLTVTLGLSFVWCFKMVANLKSCQKQTVGM